MLTQWCTLEVLIRQRREVQDHIRSIHAAFRDTYAELVPTAAKHAQYIAHWPKILAWKRANFAAGGELVSDGSADNPEAIEHVAREASTGCDGPDGPVQNMDISAEASESNGPGQTGEKDKAPKPRKRASRGRDLSLARKSRKAKLQALTDLPANDLGTVGPAKQRASKNTPKYKAKRVPARAAKPKSSLGASSVANNQKKNPASHTPYGITSHEPGEVLFYVNHMPQLRRRFTGHKQRRTADRGSSRELNLERLLLCCKKAARIGRTPTSLHGKVFLRRNLERGKKDTWRA